VDLLKNYFLKYFKTFSYDIIGQSKHIWSLDDIKIYLQRQTTNAKEIIYLKASFINIDLELVGSCSREEKKI
jgi:hypothetical protein